MHAGVNITTEGKRQLGEALGEKSTIDSYVKWKVQQWVNEVEELATVTRTHCQRLMQHSHMVWPNPTATSPTEHKASWQVTAPLVDAYRATWTVQH